MNVLNHTKILGDVIVLHSRFVIVQHSLVIQNNCNTFVIYSRHFKGAFTSFLNVIEFILKQAKYN